MRASLPAATPNRDQATALDALVDEVERLGGAYGQELLAAVGPSLDRAREVSRRGAPSGELRRAHATVEEALVEVASFHADELLSAFDERVSELLGRAALLGHGPSDLAVVIVDARSPGIPSSLRARAGPVAIESRRELARALTEEAPSTAAALTTPIGPHEQDVIVFTVGRVMRTRRQLPAYGMA